MAAILSSLQWELDNLVMGPGTDINIAHYDIGAPELITNDAPVPRGDGERHGREYRSGRTITFELNALAGDFSVLDGPLSRLTAVWDGEDRRSQAGAYSLLRYRLGNRVRRMWGSPREFQSDTSLDYQGNVPITASFRTVDPRFYDDTEQANTVSIAPSAAGGLLPPLAAPLSTLGVSHAPGVITVGGNCKTWIYFRVNGPITNPRIENFGNWHYQLNMTIPQGQSVTIDPRPWSRGVRLNGTVAVGGSQTQDSIPLAQMKVSPGIQEIILSGQDITQTASMLAAWRSAYTNY